MKIMNILYFLSASALLVGAVMKMAAPLYASYVYLTAAVVFAIVQFLMRPRGGSFVMRRLVFMQQLGGLALVAAGVLMFTHVRNEWIVALFVGALFLLYTAWRIPQEAEKDK